MMQNVIFNHKTLSVAYRYARVFIASFLASFAVEEFLLTNDSDLRVTLVRAAIAAGIVSVFKTLREAFPESETMKKLPL